VKSNRIVVVVLAATVILAATYTGCSEKVPKSKTTEGLDKEQYLNVVLGAEPKTLDPSKAADLYSSQVLTEVIEGLTRIEEDKSGKNIVRAAGAEKWTISEDGLTWTFKLRNYLWSDGQKVKASDFEYGIKRTLDPKTASSYAFLLAPIKGARAFNSKKVTEDQVGVKALDDNTLEIKLEGPCPYFLQLTYFKVMYPQRKDIVEKYGDKYGTEGNTFVFCGPFILKEWAHQDKVELLKNDKYWDEKAVKLSKVTMKIIKEENLGMNQLLSGSLDTSVVNKQEWVQKLDEAKRFNVITGYEPTTVFNFFNQKDKLFSNIKVRKAFSLAINREDIAKSLYRNLAKPAYGWCPPKLQIGTEEFRKKANFEPVKKLAEEYKDPRVLLIDGLRELAMEQDPSKVTIKLLQSGTNTRAKEVTDYMKEAYEKNLGVKVVVECIEWPVFQKRIDNMDYQIAGMAWSGDYDDPMTEFDIFMSDANMIPTGWVNKNYDDLIRKAQSTTDNNIRFEVFKNCEKILVYDDVVIAPIVYRMRNTYTAKYVKGIMSPLFGSGTELKYAYTEGRTSK